MTSSSAAPPNSLTLTECPPRIEVPEVLPNHRDIKGYTWGQLAIDFANAYVMKPGQELFAWEQHVLLYWFATDDADVYIFTNCVLVVPRQNGKSKGVAVPRMLVGAIFRGEKIKYSAQRSTTMEEIFGLCIEIVGDPDNPKHARYGARNKELFDAVGTQISFVNGHLSIRFNSGGIIYFTCRTKDAGRGETTDVNILDEAQTLTESQLADILPAQGAAESGSPQTIFIGTPPQLDRETGEAFYNKRASAIDGAPRHCIHEWSVDEVGDVSDKSRWYATNPSLGKSLKETALEDDFNTLSPVVFAIEHLCFWSTTATPYVLDPDLWDASGLTQEEVLDTIKPEDIEKRCIGVKFDPDGLQVCVSLGLLLKNGKTHCELLAAENTVSGVQRIEDLIFDKRDEIALVVLDGRTGAGEMYERLLKRKDAKGRTPIPKQQVHLMRTPEVPTAASMVVNGTAEKTFTHTKNDVLDTSAKGAERRKVGQDGYGFGGNSCAIESLAAANWAAKTTTRSSGKRKWKR